MDTSKAKREGRYGKVSHDGYGAFTRIQSLSSPNIVTEPTGYDSALIIQESHANTFFVSSGEFEIRIVKRARLKISPRKGNETISLQIFPNEGESHVVLIAVHFRRVPWEALSETWL